MNNRYAYLIIANNNPDQLQKLITMIDDSRNDIYLMIDKKSENFPNNFHVNYSGLNYVRPINIYWGGYSQIHAELILFKAAAEYHYSYYHLLSGLDLPLVNQDIIHNFFDNHPHREFLTYENPVKLPTMPNRIKHHLFRKHYRDNLLCHIYQKFERRILNLVKSPIPIDKIGYASNWVSIDDKLIHVILNNVTNIYNIYKYGYLVDELFIPTLINYYPNFKKRIFYSKPVHDTPQEFQGNMRYINWWDGNPYIWTLRDFNELVNARKEGYLFSRKFNENIDNKIITKIFNNVMNS